MRKGVEFSESRLPKLEKGVFFGGMVGVDGEVRYRWHSDGEEGGRVVVVMRREQYHHLLDYLQKEIGSSELLEFVRERARRRRGMVYLRIGELTFAALYHELLTKDDRD